MPARRPVDVPIRDESIRLGQFLKLADLAETGSDAKELILAGEVLVNGEPETRRGRQLRVGDVVELDGRPARVARRPGPAAVLARDGAVARHTGAAGAGMPGWRPVRPGPAARPPHRDRTRRSSGTAGSTLITLRRRPWSTLTRGICRSGASPVARHLRFATCRSG